MMDLKELMKKGAGYLYKGTVTGGLIGDIAGAVHNAAGSVGSGIGLWGNLLQGVNILVNGAFLFNDIREYIQLKKMRKDWKDGNRKEILKEEKFKVYFELKKEIQEIGNQMRSNGY